MTPGNPSLPLLSSSTSLLHWKIFGRKEKCFFFIQMKNKWEMHNWVLFCFVYRNWMEWETFRSIYLTFSTVALECQHADFSHFWIHSLHFQWNSHSLSDEITGISESLQSGHLVQPARAHLRLGSQNTVLLLLFLILSSSLCSLYHLGLRH